MITIKTKEEIEIMKESGKILKEIFENLKEKVKPGVKTEELDEAAYNIMLKRNAEPSFLGYHKFPKSICTSINEEVVHGIPGSRQLKEGDILSIDVGVFYEGFHTDAALTLPIGKITDEDRKLVDTAKESLFVGLKQVKEGNRVGDIASSIQRKVEKEGFSVVRDCTGHGIGRELHEDPSVPNFGEANSGPVFKEGYTLAIEPMVNAGGYQVETLDDDWTIVTRDKKKSAHFEFTILVLNGGFENLTPIAA